MKSLNLSAFQKFVAISPNPLQEIHPATITSAGLLALDDLSKSDSDMEPPSGRGKKRRLDHLTWEEKLQRKKLKNRVAAQTSRDRKKAKMDEMENTISELTERTEILQNKCTTLERTNSCLVTKNQKLENQLQQMQNDLKVLNEKLKAQHSNSVTDDVDMKSNSVCCVSNNSNRSAVSIINPLPKGMETEQTLSNYMKQQKQKNFRDNSVTAPLLKIIVLCLLCKICSKTSMPVKKETSISKNSLSFFSRVPQKTWKSIMESAVMYLPQIQVKNNNCLNEWWGPHQKAWNPAALNNHLLLINDAHLN